jgi:hypothetical protein
MAIMIQHYWTLSYFAVLQLLLWTCCPEVDCVHLKPGLTDVSFRFHPLHACSCLVLPHGIYCFSCLFWGAFEHSCKGHSWCCKIWRNQSQSHVTPADGQSVSMSWCRAPFGSYDKMFVIYDNYCCVFVGCNSNKHENQKGLDIETCWGATWKKK